MTKTEERYLEPIERGTKRAEELKAQIARLQAELDGVAPIDTMSVRKLARAIDTSPSTAHRIKLGQYDSLNMATAKKVISYLNECPCCGKKLRRKP